MADKKEPLLGNKTPEEFIRNELNDQFDELSGVLSQLSKIIGDTIAPSKNFAAKQSKLAGTLSEINKLQRDFASGEKKKTPIAREMRGLQEKRRNLEKELLKLSNGEIKNLRNTLSKQVKEKELKTQKEELNKELEQKQKDRADQELLGEQILKQKQKEQADQELLGEQILKQKQKERADQELLGEQILKQMQKELQKEQGKTQKKEDAAKKKLYDAIVSGAKAIADGLAKFVESIYETQKSIGVEAGTATRQVLGAAGGAISSNFSALFGGGPILDRKEILEASSAFTKEFGKILDPNEASRIAKEAKLLGVSSDEYIKAKRSFLGTGSEEATRTVAINAFKSAGLTAAQAIKFAAENANLVAIAGVKYADALARAAANATAIGVSLATTENFADTLVGDFEGGLERFAELSSMGVNVNFNKLAQVSAQGTPEDIVKELASQLGGNNNLLSQLQTNRFLKVAIEKDLGMSIADVTRLAGGPGTAPAELTVAEQSRDYLNKISESVSVMAKLAMVAVGANTGFKLAGLLAKSGILGAEAGAAAGPWGALIGGALGVGGALLSMGGFAEGGLITGPGSSTSDKILTPTSAGEFVVNASATRAYGSDMLNAINAKTYSPAQQQAPTKVMVDMTRLENSINKLASSMSNMKIEIDGNTVGRVSLNARSPLDRLTVVG